FAAAIVAMLPMRFQYFPGATLLLAGLAVLVFVGVQHGIWLALLGLAAYCSTMRNPLIFLYRKARGRSPQLPK
ncbi:MAG TPA: DUF2484 family protein, partial [Paracoccaceae bacterium]|nr:DUF2484 family protein [Paracoccaceae bacterium]